MTVTTTVGTTNRNVCNTSLAPREWSSLRVVRGEPLAPGPIAGSLWTHPPSHHLFYILLIRLLIDSVTWSLQLLCGNMSVNEWCHICKFPVTNSSACVQRNNYRFLPKSINQLCTPFCTCSQRLKVSQITAQLGPARRGALSTIICVLGRCARAMPSTGWTEPLPTAGTHKIAPTKSISVVILSYFSFL